MTFDRKFLLCSLAYAIAGMGIGIYMAASQNHSWFIAHAHILLVGFVLSFVYALIHRLWVAAGGTVPSVQFWLHNAAAVVMGIGLLTWYGGVQPPALEKILAASSIAVLAAALLMVYMVVKQPAPNAAARA